MSVTIDFQAQTQSIEALRGAAYRLIGLASCQIEAGEGRLVCTLTPATGPRGAATIDLDQLRTKFLDLVTDENLRLHVAARTDRVRDVILALAFGSIAARTEDQR